MLKPKQLEQLRTGAKVLKGVKAVSNALGTSPTDTPDVNTTTPKKYGEDDGTTGNNQSESDYKLDENGVGSLVNKAATPKFKDKNRRKAY